MPSSIREICAVSDLAVIANLNVTDVRDAKDEFGGTETGIDVVFEFDGHRVGAQVTEFHSDEGSIPGKKGSFARAEEQKLSKSSNGVYGLYINPEYRRSLLIRIQEKIAKAEKHKSKAYVDKYWLVVSACISSIGAGASTMILPSLITPEQLNALCHAALFNSDFDQVYLVLAMPQIIYRWERLAGWSKISDPDKHGRTEGRSVQNSVMAMISPNWRVGL